MRTSERPRIVVILPRGEALRNFVYTGALDRVAAVADLTVLSVWPNDEFRELLTTRFDDVRPLVTINERRVVKQVRELLDVAHGRWLWSKAAQSRWRVRDSEATTPIKVLKRSVKKMGCVPFANPIGLHVLSAAERFASRILRTNQEFTDLFQSLRPTLVFNASHVHSEIAVQPIQAAQWLGIPTATFIFSWDNLTSQGRVIPFYDHYITWNENLRRQLLDIYPVIRPEQVVVTGTPQFDYHFRSEFYWTREEYCRHVGADPARPIVLYTTGMANPLFGEPRIVEGIANVVRDMTDCGPPQLLVRVYPKDQTNRFDELKQRRPDILFPYVPWEPTWLTPRYEDAFLLTNTLRHAAVGINVASTVSLELCMFGIPVVNVGYNPPGMDIRPWDNRQFYSFEHYRPVAESGALTIAWEEAEVEGLLREALREPLKRRPQQIALTNAMFGTTLDGKAADRVADWLVAWAYEGRQPGRQLPRVAAAVG